MRPALLVVDMQKNAFALGPATAQSLQFATYQINRTIALFREKRLPVICIQHIDPKEGLTPGTEGFDLPEEIAILPSDLHIHKSYGNAFNKTPLEAELKRLGVDTVIVTGYCAEYCVLSTCRGAEDLDLTAIVLRGSIASHLPEHVRFVETISELITLDALSKTLEPAG